MKLDANALRYMSKEEYRTLQAVELGQKNHDLVPVPLIESIAKLRCIRPHECLHESFELLPGPKPQVCGES